MESDSAGEEVVEHYRVENCAYEKGSKGQILVQDEFRARVSLCE